MHRIFLPARAAHGGGAREAGGGGKQRTCPLRRFAPPPPHFVQGRKSKRGRKETHPRDQWALQGRVYHAALWRARRAACMPCNSNLPCGGYMQEPQSPSPDKLARRLTVPRARRRCAKSCSAFSNPASPSRVQHDPSRQFPLHPRAPRAATEREELADRSAVAHADEQSRRGSGGAPGRAGRLWRHRAGGARLESFDRMWRR